MRLRLRPLNVWLEPLAMLVVVGAIIRAYFYFQTYAHFPQPFFYEPFDVWMDWFNTSYWAYNTGAYDVWGTLYPPVSFVFLRIFSLGACYKEADGYSIRECDWIGLATLHGFFLLNVILLFLTYRKVDRATAIWRAVALGFGLPCLYGLERGNLVVVCFTFLILGFGPLLRSARWKWFAVGMAVNFKVYLIAALFSQLLRRRWLWFEGSLIAVVVIYIVTFVLVGAGRPDQIYNNIVTMASDYQAITFLDLWYAATYRPLMSIITGQSWIVTSLFGSRAVDLVYFLVLTVHYSTMLAVGLAAVAVWLRPEVVPVSRLALLGLLMATLGAEPGGYTECFLIFFIFLEKWRGLARVWSIFASYILCMPLDIILGRVPPTVQESYLAGHATFFTYYITLGPFLRPFLILSIGLAMSFLTISQVWSDIRLQGWRGRYRYRYDAALLPGVIAPKMAPRS